MQKDWETYWAEALAEYNEADRIFGPGDVDDIWATWPGREDGMAKAYLKGARRHFETLQNGDYPEQARKLRILIEIGVARAGVQMAALDHTAPLSLQHMLAQSGAVEAHIYRLCQQVSGPDEEAGKPSHQEMVL